MRISDWSSDVCSSDLLTSAGAPGSQDNRLRDSKAWAFFIRDTIKAGELTLVPGVRYETIDLRSEEHTSELQSLMRISYAVFCLKKITSIQPSHPQLLTHSIAYNTPQTTY